ncbi:MAG: hypothetical protein JNJ60_16805 [Rhodocyclaceae bacterium]|nr:hypothetical protein [Rhodocyclaceae bacterium]
MFKQSIKLVFSVWIMLFAALCLARSAVPIEAVPDIEVRSLSGAPVEEAKVRKAILDAAASQNWLVAPAGDGRIKATLHVRGKHTAVVAITYDATKVTIKYQDSVDLKYGVENGVQVIHPFYNKWVRALADAIRIQLGKL